MFDFDEGKIKKFTIDNHLAVLGEMQRVIKPGGRVALGFLDEKDLKKLKYTQTGVYKLYNGDKAIELLSAVGFSQARYEKKKIHQMGMGICAVAENDSCILGHKKMSGSFISS